MGAANSLRWKEDPGLCEEVDAVVDTIVRAAEPDGFFEPIPRASSAPWSIPITCGVDELRPQGSQPDW